LFESAAYMQSVAVDVGSGRIYFQGGFTLGAPMTLCFSSLHGYPASSPIALI
jgi:hypothetical protein